MRPRARAFRAELKIPHTLGEIGIPEDKAEIVGRDAFRDPSTGDKHDAIRGVIVDFVSKKSWYVFQYDKDSGLTYFKIVSAKTGEVIRQVPAEEIITMARKLRELANPKDAQGVLMDQES